MRICYLGRTELRIHALMLPVLALAAIAGFLDRFLEAALAVMLHESCHAVTARALGYRIASVELMPFGGVARLESGHISAASEFCIAMAGPVCSFVTAAALTTAMRLFPGIAGAVSGFFRINLVIAVLNMLPVLPLDGGRMLRALLERGGGNNTARAAAWAGVALGAMMAALGAYMLLCGMANVSLLLFGLFLFLAAWKEVRQLPEHRLHGMLRRQDAIRRGEQVNVHHCVLRGGMRAAEALPLFPGGKYALVRVLDDAGKSLGELSETELIAGVSRYGAQVTLAELLTNAISR